MYQYHNRIKQRIAAGELIGHYFTDSYPNIGEALVLVFNTAPFLQPIRPHRWPEYVDILADWRRSRDAIGNQGNDVRDHYTGGCLSCPEL